ncbi:MAG: PAS domain S-box protein [Bacteroidota bacterium]
MIPDELTLLANSVAKTSSAQFLVILDPQGGLFYLDTSYSDPNCNPVRGGNEPFAELVQKEDDFLFGSALKRAVSDPTEPVRVALRILPPDHHTSLLIFWEFSFRESTENHSWIIGKGHVEGFPSLESRNSEKSSPVDWKNLLQHFTEGWFTLDHNWRFTHINQLATHYLGKPEDELVGKRFWEEIPEQMGMYQQLQSFHLSPGERNTIRFEEYRGDLKACFDTTIHPLPEGLLVLIRDCTSEYTTLQALKNSEAKLKAILNSSSDSHVLIGKDFEILGFNNRAAEGAKSFLGKELQIGKSMMEYIAPGLEQVFLDNTSKALSGEYLRKERKLVFEDGQTAWFMFTFYPVYDDAGNLIGVSYATTNIDKLKRAQEKLVASERSLNAIYNSATEAISFVSMDLKILFNNRVAKEYYKQHFNKSPKPGDSWIDFVDPENRQAFTSRANRVLSGENLEIEENHGSQWFLASYFPVYNDHQEMVGIAHTVKDITLQKQHELQAIAQNEKLKKIAWKQSHKFRSPVARILGLVGLMENESLGPKSEEYLHYLRKSAEQLDETISDIMEDTFESRQK